MTKPRDMEQQDGPRSDRHLVAVPGHCLAVSVGFLQQSAAVAEALFGQPGRFDHKGTRPGR
jgi:hypothetical protein